MLKRNPNKPCRQDVITCVASARATVVEEMISTLLRRCGISTALDGSEDREFSTRLAGVQLLHVPVPPHNEDLRDEGVDVILHSNSDVSFDRFEE